MTLPDGWKPGDPDPIRDPHTRIIPQEYLDNQPEVVDTVHGTYRDFRAIPQPMPTQEELAREAFFKSLKEEEEREEVEDPAPKDSTASVSATSYENEKKESLSPEEVVANMPREKPREHIRPAALVPPVSVGKGLMNNVPSPPTS